MSASLVYLDSSAIVKLVVRERESNALFEWLGGWPERISSAIARVEVLRALRRSGAAGALQRRASDLLDRIALLPIDRPVIEVASELGPADLPSLDAIHLATALSVGEDLVGLVTYDDRLTAAATRAHIEVWTPT